MKLVCLFFIVMCVDATAQEVKLPPDAAKYFLEVHDKYQILAKQDSLNNLIIENFQYTVNTKDLYITSLNKTVKIQQQIIDTKSQEVVLLEDENKHLKKQVRKERLKTAVTAIVGGVLVVLALL